MWASTSRRSSVSSAARPVSTSVRPTGIALVPPLHRPPRYPDAPTPTPWNLACSSIAGRRASGFLQVSLSKVSRHRHRAARPANRAETPPITLTTARYLSVGSSACAPGQTAGRCKQSDKLRRSSGDGRSLVSETGRGGWCHAVVRPCSQACASVNNIAQRRAHRRISTVGAAPLVSRVRGRCQTLLQRVSTRL